jgi:hypothetical protein
MPTKGYLLVSSAVEATSIAERAWYIWQQFLCRRTLTQHADMHCMRFEQQTHINNTLRSMDYPASARIGCILVAHAEKQR